jgi:hypothetical protein
MTAWLRLLGIVVLAIGIGGGTYAATRAAGDATWPEIAAQFARHSDSLVFAAEYYPAAARHYALVAGAVVGIVGGLVFGSLLLGVATLTARAPQMAMETAETKKAG